MEFIEYVRTRGPALQRLGYLLAGDAHLGEDLVQTALMKAYRRWSRLREPDAYVRRTMVNAHLDWRRRRSAAETPAEAAVVERGAASVADHSDGVAAQAEMWQALGELPRKQRAVLVLRFYEDLDDAAIGALLGCAESTVRSQASRALGTLRVGWTRTRGAVR
ncbi:SigE family RNA polymerase sigma factor [Umezawaea sp.]|uniref:SigE family RNA polymerase sigma factor n=1 Tax=Umezawaea sp. TaxID=1955258 RepID=UPI002ED3C8E3